MKWILGLGLSVFILGAWVAPASAEVATAEVASAKVLTAKERKKHCQTSCAQKKNLKQCSKACYREQRHIRGCARRCGGLREDRLDIPNCQAVCRKNQAAKHQCKQSCRTNAHPRKCRKACLKKAKTPLRLKKARKPQKKSDHLEKTPAPSREKKSKQK